MGDPGAEGQALNCMQPLWGDRGACSRILRDNNQGSMGPEGPREPGAGNEGKSRMLTGFGS